ncbi:MAG: helix-hairpin-helix domain-containing protein [Bacteroidota bacterium]
MRTLLFFSLLFIPLVLSAQRDSISTRIPDYVLENIEDFLQNTDSEGVFDFNTLLEELEAYLEDPLNLNAVTENDLRNLQLLSDAQISNFFNYRLEAGPFISIYEIQAIPGFDQLTVRRILPFVKVGGGLDDFQVPLGEMISEGKNEFYLRWSRILEEQEGYIDSPELNRAAAYEGDPNQLYFRYKHSYSNRLSFGVTAEKDRGEAFFRGSNPQGFDYYSAHFYLKDYRKWLKSLAIGDYNVSFGQGLILFSGFGYGKSSVATLVKRNSRTITPYSSVNEVNFKRGLAATFGLGDKWEVTVLGSFNQLDGNIVLPDTSDLADDRELASFTSFDFDGLHRTAAEIEDEKVIDQLTVGSSVKYIMERGHIAINALYDRFDKPLQRTIRPDNQFQFNSDRIFNGSLDYSYRLRNINLFGETAISDNGAIATINGALISLDRYIDLSVVYRNYPKDYQALNANPFGETTGARNETGYYIGMEFRPVKNWTLTAYFDSWRHPWLRFQVDAPSRGHEYRVRLTYYLKRRLRAYLEVREEVKERNAPFNDNALNFLIPFRLFQTRLHFGYQLSKDLELRSRIDYGFAFNEIEGYQKGFVVLQDLLYRPAGSPWSFTTRFALFDTDGYDIRFYHYENALLYNFSIPAYYNKGSRFYFNLRCRPFKGITIEGRIAQTFWSNRNTIGSGLEEINGPVRTQVSAQVKYQF